MIHTADSIAAWRRLRIVDDLRPFIDDALAIFAELRATPRGTGDVRLGAILRRHPRAGGMLYSKNLLVRIYRQLCADGAMAPDQELLRRLRMKPTRTNSGVATVTVLTRPHPCPARCIFCPSDPRLPRSYLPDEPGAQRAAQHAFDPHEQVASRIEALYTNGHPVDKIELLVLGGSWSSYPHAYQAWFVRRCLDALNGRPAADLATAQCWNETAPHRNVGLVVETRPDLVRPAEVRRLRRLGVTKLQLGAQSLDDAVLARNRRGHDVEATRRALTLLRAAGFKLVLHWMPNLLGATPASDRIDSRRLWSDPALRPDELKIYPCSLLANTELYAHWQRGAYRPYGDAELTELVADCKAMVPPYCRINRVVRDIPTLHIVAGCRISNLRQAAQRRLAASGRACRCIRCREVREQPVTPAALRLDDRVYATRASVEHFLSCEREDGRLAGYTRLSLPAAPIELGIAALAGAALVRELHVCGPALPLGAGSQSAADDTAPGRHPTAVRSRTAAGQTQHRGLGKRLLAAAERLARRRGFARLAIIASVGTRRYYAARGYRLDGTYMVKEL